MIEIGPNVGGVIMGLAFLVVVVWLVWLSFRENGGPL